MRAQTLGQTLATDFRRMAWIYPSAIAVAIAFMAFQSISGVKVFTFDSRKPAKFFQPAPAPEIRPEDIRNIRDEILQSQRLIQEMQEQLATAKTEVAALATKSSELDVLRGKNEELAAKISAQADLLANFQSKLAQSDLATADARLNETARRVGMLETLVAGSSKPSYYSWTLAPAFESLGLVGFPDGRSTPFKPYDGHIYYFPNAKDATIKGQSSPKPDATK